MVLIQSGAARLESVLLWAKTLGLYMGQVAWPPRVPQA